MQYHCGIRPRKTILIIVLAGEFHNGIIYGSSGSSWIGIMAPQMVKGYAPLHIKCL